uniref:Thioredoxin domain-containing protein n=1 Tax=Timema bartmani TaxID=61472 RepID=A0A7R9F813_9NEOP|nr:unnamed protein product [Timema bartmani]
MLTGKDDERSSKNLIEAAIEESCLRFHQAQKAHAPVFPRATYYRKTPRNFTGLACRTNKTLSFLAMDSVQFHQFAEGLGVNVLARKDKTAVVIFNAVDESSYLLEAELSKGSLVDFIVNYTEGSLSRSLRSTAKKPIALNRYPEINSQNCQQDEGSICVPELTTDTFFSTVLDKDKAVVVLYHTPYCGFCHGVAHIFLTVARYFRTVAKLQFARIDGEHNDLPWEYTMDHFPAILFFPARRKSESRVFPRHLPVTVPNLVNFVLANLGPSESKLQGLIGLCAAWERGHDDKSARDCLTRVRQECLTIIANTLAVCRTTRLRRRFYLDSSSVRDSVSRHHQQLLYKKMKLLFLKLQHIKEIHLLLGSLDRLREDSRVFRIIQSIFQVYLCSFNNGSADIPTSPETESIPIIDTRQATLQGHENVKDEL